MNSTTAHFSQVEGLFDVNEECTRDFFVEIERHSIWTKHSKAQRFGFSTTYSKFYTVHEGNRQIIAIIVSSNNKITSLWLVQLHCRQKLFRPLLDFSLSSAQNFTNITLWILQVFNIFYLKEGDIPHLSSSRIIAKITNEIFHLYTHYLL